MNEKKEKFQITLPVSLAKRVEEDIQQKFMSKSLWFEKIITDYFKGLDNDKNKKVIDLDF